MPPSTYRRKTQSQPSAEEMETTYQADLHWDLPLSTAASAAHSQPHQQVMIDNAGYGLFEPVAEDSGNSNFSAILSGQPAPQSQQQQVSGDFTPGAGAGTNEWYQQQNNTVYSDYSGLSAAQLSSPARSTPSQQSFSFPANPNPNTFDSSTGFHQLYYPDRHLPRFDFPGSTEQYASSAPPTDMHYMSSPEQQYHRTQPIFSATSQAPLLGRQNITTGQSAPLTIVSPIKITSQESAGFNTGWGTVDTNVIAPDGSGSVGLRRL
ncbi:hypothetical protein V565_163770 [Rhizoctonia solani 123E]|uniref:Uncharacterized protein n=1 Tax=Rhizoctonia solani 123E TaxID=1423351 RepID=A0A074SB28_9AGAM|nr:hypothetical protein V565_163770 [Rhizoctonia solani 123E]